MLGAITPRCPPNTSPHHELAAEHVDPLAVADR